MQQKKKTFSEKLQSLNIRGGVALFFLLANLSALGYYYYMTTEVHRVERVLELKQQELVEKRRQLIEIKKDDGYKRYQAAKIVKRSSDMMDRLENTQYLINMLNMMYALDEEDGTLELDKVTVGDGSVKLSGRASALQSVYREGGVIDTFKALPFVHEFEIPGYSNSLQGVAFDLSAKVQGYEG